MDKYLRKNSAIATSSGKMSGEYSIVKDAAFCLYFYVFREENGSQGGGPCFTGEVFRNWKKKEMLRQYVGGANNAHNKARRRCESLMNQKAHVATFFFNHSKIIKREYRVCLTVVIDCIRFLLKQGLAFRGNNESQSSNNKGKFLELLRFLADHNEEIKAVSLKASLDTLFARHGLSMSKLCGQGYYGASNIQGELNGLKTLILKENESAYYIYCFVHQLQLALVFLVAKFINIVAASSKQFDILREKHSIVVNEALKIGELKSGQGMNQEINLKRVGDTHICKLGLQRMRKHGWNSLLSQVSSFCEKHFIRVPVMEKMFLTPGRSRRRAQEITNMHHYRIDLFCAILDMQLQELNSRFNEVNTELLLCLACLCPKDSFATFNKEKLLCLTQLYPKDFSLVNLMTLDTELDVYIMDMQSSVEFSRLNGIDDLAQKIRMGDEWLNDNLVVYIGKDVFDCIDNETILQHFQHMKSH
ncbi:hypothetical protein CISIN_1g043976mg [Citrus sinensis]|uniref:TTF-type domain-containing protein n=1 Tax=Citrus sinensis TaxID=2711 RepID=A0A067D8S5_CITSI|nr:hypothetical protein CISIN_1g043976mg [Citrus sinensis]